MNKIKWPEGKQFAFTIIDDTDNSTINNVKPVYDLLQELGFRSTKTVWAFKPRDHYTGQSLEDEEYLKFIKDIKKSGFEIAFHNAGSGDFNREEILSGVELFRKVLGEYPKMQINHASNKDSIYWGKKRFSAPLKKIYSFFYGEKRSFWGEDPKSYCFWGDFCKKHIKYLRNRVFTGINTMSYDKYMPYLEKSKEEYSNYWFSSSDGKDLNTFKRLISKKNVNKLFAEGGCCIVYTHFAFGFVNEEGRVDEEFSTLLRYIASLNGWLAPASEILDYIKSNQEREMYLSRYKSFLMDLKWLKERVIRKLLYKI